MDPFRRLAFCPPGTAFFDAARDTEPEGDFALTSDTLPEGWTRGIGNDWVVMGPDTTARPLQGWKIHVSATPENAERVLEVTWRYCVARGVMFKYLRGLPVLLRRNSKYGDRSASGKFVTIYPVDDEHLARVLEELGELLDGEAGPYILSDLRWRSGPLYVRYGGFVNRMTRTPAGDLVHCIEDPQGRLVPDERRPGFRPPAWVRLPDCLGEALEARNRGTLRDFPYKVSRALHFSNGGGVYQGEDLRTGAKVLLREARPLAGLDRRGRDALTRHEREQWALQRLAGVPCIPALLDYRQGHEHYFLVREYVEGEPLGRVLLRRNPLVRGVSEPQEYADYAVWALGVLAQVSQGVADMHERGVVFGDLHPGNVLVRRDDSVVFIDFETASPIDEHAGQEMAAAGFTAPAGYGGAAVDRYALGSLRLAVFVPLVELLPWSTHKLDDLLSLVTSTFPLPDDFAAAVRADLGPAFSTGSGEVSGSEVWTTPERDTWPGLRAALADGILGTATPHRTDRLFPGDAEQFSSVEGGLNLAFGAAGVLWTQTALGRDVPPEHVDWLVDRVQRLAAPGSGFYTGLSGIAFALHALGRQDTAHELVLRALADAVRTPDVGLLSGLAGVGLTALHLAADDASLLAAAGDIADRLVGERELPERNFDLGLMRGGGGTALFLLRLYERTGDPQLLDQAEAALRKDLAGLGWTPGEGFADEAVGSAPVIASGCAGTGMVVHDLLAHRPDPELAAARDAIAAAAATTFVLQSGLFHGRAGALVAAQHMRGGQGDDDVCRRHVAALGLHVVPHEGRPALLGQQGLRISTDLATGGSGVLLSLDTALTARPTALPFF